MNAPTSLTDMIKRTEQQLDRVLTPEELYMATRAHALGMTLEQFYDRVVEVEQAPTPRPTPPRTFRYEAVGRQVQQLGEPELTPEE